MEHVAKPELSVKDGTLMLPEIQTGHQGIDNITHKSWLGYYSRISEVLRQLTLIDSRSSRSVDSTFMHPESKELLRERVGNWKVPREQIW